ncbi:DUF2157 domain-containing protein [Arenibaculum sp.]|uniref:DUF2157 domain-containing protein n=1 Tax=Arenibaculum sp. TaxID=2865862 RepID=UPI002E102135|nr:DUF2157 domain-containing protein [Arenibaculum sp.]
MIDLHGRAVRSRIERWRDAGLIDDETAGRLAAFEASRPAAGVPALTVIGALSVALGIVAIVSANWDQIPVPARLGGHVALNLAIGIAVWTGIARELLILVLSASTLGLLAHVGQSFQLQGGAAGLLAGWLALATPFTWALARGAANRWLWTAGLFAAAGTAFVENADALADAGLVGTSIALFIVAGYAAPLADRGAWGRHLHAVMLGVLVTAASAAQTVWRSDFTAADLPAGADVIAGAACATAGLLAVHAALARRAPGRPWLTAFVAASPAYAALPFLAGGADSAVVAALGFCLYWWAISQLAHAAGLTGLYRLAVLAIAARVVVVFIEAFGGLLFTGVGLVAGGVLLLAVGWLVRRLLRNAGRAA